jgi:hypothetical protein
MKLLLLFCIFAVPLQIFSQTTHFANDLQKYIGYYDVGVKPGRPTFKARLYQRDHDLYIIFDGDKDHKLVFQEDGSLRFEFDTLSRYKITFSQQAEKVKAFKVIRPRDKWSTDLYAERNVRLNNYAVDTEKLLNYRHTTSHFQFNYCVNDTAVVKKYSQTLEQNYDTLLSAFTLGSIPKITIRIYPDMDTYHNAVLTPNAPDWQMGRAWSKTEIRMLSPMEAQKISKEDIHMNEIVIHEFIHCLHLHLVKTATRVPGWLWEGLAMYKGCCQWADPKDLEYLKRKKYPTLKDIRNDPTYQQKYELGYYLIEYIEKSYGWERVLNLISTNGDVKKSLRIPVRSFEEKFYQYMEKEYLR